MIMRGLGARRLRTAKRKSLVNAVVQVAHNHNKVGEGGLLRIVAGFAHLLTNLRNFRPREPAIAHVQKLPAGHRRARRPPE